MKRKPRKVQSFHATLKQGITCYGPAPWLMKCLRGFCVGERVKVTVESCRTKDRHGRRNVKRSMPGSGGNN